MPAAQSWSLRALRVASPLSVAHDRVAASYRPTRCLRARPTLSAPGPLSPHTSNCLRARPAVSALGCVRRLVCGVFATGCARAKGNPAIVAYLARFAAIPSVAAWYEAKAAAKAAAAEAKDDKK